MLFQTSRVAIEVGDTVSDFFNRPTITLKNWDAVNGVMLAKREEWMKFYHPE